MSSCVSAASLYKRQASGYGVAAGQYPIQSFHCIILYVRYQEIINLYGSSAGALTEIHFPSSARNGNPFFRGFMGLIQSTQFECNKRNMMLWGLSLSGAPSNTRKSVLSKYLVKSQSHEIGSSNHRIALKFDRRLGSSAAETPVKFQSDWILLILNLATSRRCEIWR